MSEKTMKNNSSGRKEGGDTRGIVKKEALDFAVPVLLPQEQIEIFRRIAEALEHIDAILEEKFT